LAHAQRSVGVIAASKIEEHGNAIAGRALTAATARRDRTFFVIALSADWRLAIAYNAVLQCAKIGLAACGHRIAKGPSHHYYAIESMRETVGLSEDDVRLIDTFRKKRNISDYERAGLNTDSEAEELVELAKEIRGRVKMPAAWSDSKPLVGVTFDRLLL